MTPRVALSPGRILGLVAVAGAAGPSWRWLFGWWARDGAVAFFGMVERHSELRGATVVLAGDVLFALVLGLLAAWLFLRLTRPLDYAGEAVVLPVFLASLTASAVAGGDGWNFFLRLPALWLFVMSFAITVGYGIKFRRRKVRPSGS